MLAILQQSLIFVVCFLLLVCSCVHVAFAASTFSTLTCLLANWHAADSGWHCQDSDPAVWDWQYWSEQCKGCPQKGHSGKHAGERSNNKSSCRNFAPRVGYWQCALHTLLIAHFLWGWFTNMLYVCSQVPHALGRHSFALLPFFCCQVVLLCLSCIVAFNIDILAEMIISVP